MKKILYLFSIAMLLWSCGDNFLDTEPLTQKVNTNFYKTADDVDKALIAAYSAVAPTDISTCAFIVSELKSDDRFPGGGPDDTHALATGESRNISNDMYLAPWRRNYQGIFRVNMLLESLDQIEADQTFKDKAEGEARFLRAYFYFELVKMFGTVPLVLETAPANLPKAEVDELYAQIATDLKLAIEKLPAERYSVNDIGRATKWAAEGYMARIFLFYTGVYGKESMPLVGGGTLSKAQVVTYVDDAVKNSGHSLVPDFRNLWPYAYSNDEYAYAKDNNLQWVGEEGGNTECMFSIRYSNAGSWSYTFFTNQLPLFFGWREQKQIPFGQGWGWGPVNSQLFDEWPSNDLRKQASIIDVEDDSEGITDYEWHGDHQQQETGYWQKKYVPVNIRVNDQIENYSVSLYDAPTDYMLNNTQETQLLRYADLLLMGAELGSANAQNYLDQVRSRAKLASVPVTLENIKKERRFELAFEGLRYYDLLRWGDIATAIAKVKNVAVTNDGKSATYSATYRPETKGFLPIPGSQIQLSDGVLVQNPGW